LRFAKLLERISLRVGDGEPIAQWLGVYQSLPESAKSFIDIRVQKAFEKIF